MKTLTEYEKGYLSAMIDGEGSITYYKTKRHDCKRAGINYFQVRLAISNNNLELLEYIKKMVNCGGSIISKKSKRYPDTISYELRYSHNIIRWLIPQLHLIEKKEKAKKALDLLNALQPYSNRFCDKSERDEAWKIVNVRQEKAEAYNGFYHPDGKLLAKEEVLDLIKNPFKKK